MHLAAPLYLLLLPLVPLLVWWWLRRRRRAVRHPLAGWLAALPSGRARLARYVGAALRGLALVLLVLALAGPRWPDLRTPIHTEGIALMMLLDVSGSMGERDFNWNNEPITRLEAVQRVFRLFVAGSDSAGPVPLPDGRTEHFQGRPTDLVGLVTFAARPDPTCPLTLSHTALLHLLDDAHPLPPPDSETNLSDAIVMGLHRLRSAGPRRKVLVLLTDGEHNRLEPASRLGPLSAAHVAAGLGVPIYTIDAGPTLAGGNEVGSADPDSPSFKRAQAEQTLRELAGITGGRYFPAHDTSALLDACHALDRLERNRIQSFQYRRYHEAYPWLGLAAFGCWAVVLALESTLWRRLP
jgi:Ca-activated chloride channel family protein